MVRNEDIRREFNMFADIWKAYKALLPVGAANDERYWDEVMGAVPEIMKKYPGKFTEDLLLAVVSDLERRCAENEDQDSGR